MLHVILNFTMLQWVVWLMLEQKAVILLMEDLSLAERLDDAAAGSELHPDVDQAPKIH